MYPIEVNASPHNLHEIGIRMAAFRLPGGVRRQVAAENVQRAARGGEGSKIPARARAKKASLALSPKLRSERARKAVMAREVKRKAEEKRPAHQKLTPEIGRR